ncbi:MAG: TRAM domain-containing protein [Propionibacteriaceae bacterium]|jgi:tRNA/tmRNA/rRNA uracil-C5-methylase (TrmA/RlmC/RlmD family)|nr:TRAM domain-containing protein [Propionibacteriaceae bacterium]
MTETIGPLIVTDVAHGGWCVARDDGRVVFVSGTLPGEVVTAEVIERRSRLWFARAREILTASPDRVPHIWPLAERTGVGGADLGHVALEAQRRWKADVIAHQLRRIAHLEAEVTVEAAPGDDERDGLRWRDRLDLVVDDDHRLAMHASGAHRLVALDEMPLAHEIVAAALAAVDDAPGRPGERVRIVRASGESDEGVAHIVALSDAVADDHDVEAADSPRRGRRASRPPRQVGGDDPAPVLTQRVETARGTWTYRVAADGFWQAHRQAGAVLVDAVLDSLGDLTGARVLDLYSGSGLFTLPLAAAVGEGGSVAAVEGDERAAAAVAVATIEEPVTVWNTDVRQALGPEGKVARRADAVVCDPPRSGLGREAVEGIVQRRPREIAYVSCDPASLARDLGFFQERGYELAHLRAFDLFPHTHHVESLALLRPLAD